MKPACKTVCLLLFFFISFLYTQTSAGEEYPPDDRLFFLEEIFISEGNFLFNEPVVGEEPLPNEEILLSGENVTNEESPSSEETLSVVLSDQEASPTNETQSQAAFSGGEQIVVEQALGEAALSAEEAAGAEEALLSEAALSDEEINTDKELFSLEDIYSDEYAYLFEAPPLVFEVPTFENRSIDTLFPNFSLRHRAMALNHQVLRFSFKSGESATLIPNPDLEINLLASIMRKNPSHIIEALVLVPYIERELDLLDIYNALGRIQNIKDNFVLVRGSEYYIFTESTRIDNTRNRRAISDPAPAVMLPFSETMYLRLKEVSFGNLFIRGDISISMYGITYSMTNFTDVRYFLVPIMGAERYSTIIYLEPVKEGMLIYSITGFYLPGFIADRVNLTPSINRRIDVFLKWITEGLRIQETATYR